VVIQLISILKYTFPEYQLQVIEIKDLLKKHFFVLFLNLYHMAKLYRATAFLHGKDAFYNHFFGTPFMFTQIQRLLRDYINVNDYLFTIQDNSLFDGSVPGLPHFVYTDHTILANKQYPKFNPKKDLLAEEWLELERTIYSNACLVLTRSENARNSIITDYYCNANKIKTIYYAPYNTMPNGHRAEKYASMNILFIGTQWKLKGGPQLLTAFRQVLDAVPDASLTIVGCHARVSLRNVRIVGTVSREKVSEYFENAAVFCVPTRGEPFGTVFIEALAHALPIVGTNTGAVEECVFNGVNGYLVDVDDTMTLAEKLVDLVTNPSRCATFGEQSLNIYERRFTLKCVSRKLKTYVTPYIRSS